MAVLSILCLLSACTTHVSYLSETELDDGGGDAGESDDGGAPGVDADPATECVPGETRPCEAPQCAEPGTCVEPERCGEDGRWAGCGEECPPGVEVPEEERLDDGIDNDCDGVVDECDGATEGCECEAECVPGTARWCENPLYCSWGQQVCADAGTWGPCRETAAPEACSSFAWFSPEAEVCIVDAGECIQDMWDLDYDGDTWESIGESCEPAPCP